LAAEPEPRTIREVIERVQVDWAALEKLISGLSETQFTAPGPDGWSVKDHLAHIGEWDNELVAVLAGRPQAEGFSLDSDTYQRLGSIDALNEVLYERHRHASISEVQAAARCAHAEVLAALGRLSDADLMRTVADLGVDPSDDRPLREKIAVDSYAHYAEHTGWIRELLSSFEPRSLE
jgi:hypothetical protein